MSLSRDKGARGCLTSASSTANSPVESAQLLAGPGQHSRAEIQFAWAEPNHGVVPRWRAVVQRGLSPTEHRVDPRDQFAGLNGFGR